MPEWLNGPVLKTVEVIAYVGSNPTPTALLEGWQSGLMRRFAKPLRRKSHVGSNPTPSAERFTRYINCY